MPIAMTDKNNNKYYLHYDQVGSLRAVTDSNGNLVKEIVYNSYGNIISDTNPDFKVPFGFAGGLYDPDTKLVHFGFREYDPEIGRWLSKDPLLFGGGDSNLYGYVLQDPVNLVDPWGLMWGDKYGQEALEYWVNKELTTGNKLYLIPEFFAALWTPDTSDKTFDVLMTCLPAKYIKTNYHGPHNQYGPHIHWGPKRNPHPKAPRKWHFDPKNPNHGKPKGQSEWSWRDWFNSGRPWGWK